MENKVKINKMSDTEFASISGRSGKGNEIKKDVELLSGIFEELKKDGVKGNCVFDIKELFASKGIEKEILKANGFYLLRKSYEIKLLEKEKNDAYKSTWFAKKIAVKL